MRLVDPDVLEDHKYWLDNPREPTPRKVRPQSQFWLEDGRLETLTKLYTKGTAVKLIAAELGTNRDAVIGKAHRLGLVHGSAKNS